MTHSFYQSSTAHSIIHEPDFSTTPPPLSLLFSRRHAIFTLDRTKPLPPKLKPVALLISGFKTTPLYYIAEVIDSFRFVPTGVYYCIEVPQYTVNSTGLQIQ